MTIEEELRTFVLADATVAAITTTMAENVVPQVESDPYVWFRNASEEEDVDLDGNGGLIYSRFDLEAVSRDLAEAKALGRALSARLNGYRGAMGAIHTDGCFIEGKDDDYVPFNEFTDEDLHVVALDLLIIHN